MTEKRLDFFARLLDRKWESAVRWAVDKGYTTEQIREACDAINYYPSEEFWKHEHMRRSERKALDNLNRIFFGR